MRVPGASLRKSIAWSLASLIGLVPVHAEVLKGPYLVDMTRDSTRIRLVSDVLLPTEVRLWPESDPSSSRIFLAQPESLSAQVRAVSAESPRKVVDRDEVHYLYDAQIPGLKPGTDYGYQVLQGGAPMGGGRFHTFEERPERIRFIALGDVRTGHEFYRELARQFRAQRPSFVTIAGDLAVDGKAYVEWQAFFDVGKEYLADIPLVPAWGNHDGRASYFDRFFPFPRGYNRSVDCGPVHLVTVDSGNDEEAGELKWLDQDLTAAREMPWKIAIYHHPSFNEGGHASAFGLTKLLPLLKRHKVDMTISGHSHIYERCFPLKSVLKDEQPIVHVITGGGGAPPAADQDAFFIAIHANRYHYLVMEASPTELTGTAYGLDGKPFDSFTLRKHAPETLLDGAKPLFPSVPNKASASSAVAATELPGKVVAEESVALWRALRGSFDARARYRVPEPKAGKPPEPLPGEIPWWFKAPASPLPRRLPLQISLSPSDRDIWSLPPEVVRFEWGPESISRLFTIRPKTSEALTRQVPPRLEVRVENILVGFIQYAPLKMTFAKDGQTTRRARF